MIYVVQYLVVRFTLFHWYIVSLGTILGSTGVVEVWGSPQKWPQCTQQLPGSGMSLDPGVKVGARKYYSHLDGQDLGRQQPEGDSVT